MADKTTDWAAAWREIIIGPGKSWVVFENGTCVVLMAPDGSDPATQATALLQEYGQVQTGTPSADFEIIELAEYPGWVVTCHHPDILNYVPADALAEKAGPPDLLVGLMGRSARDEDARHPVVIAIQTPSDTQE